MRNDKWLIGGLVVSVIVNLLRGSRLWQDTAQAT